MIKSKKSFSRIAIDLCISDCNISLHKENKEAVAVLLRALAQAMFLFGTEGH